MILDYTPCSRCGSSSPNSSCYVCGDNEPEESADDFEVVSSLTAKANGFKPLTLAYQPYEYPMMRKLMEEPGFEHVAVQTGLGLEVWRKPITDQ